MTCSGVFYKVQGCIQGPALRALPVGFTWLTGRGIGEPVVGGMCAWYALITGELKHTPGKHDNLLVAWLTVQLDNS